jgi:hypothetical protein
MHGIGHRSYSAAHGTFVYVRGGKEKLRKQGRGLK